MRRLWRVLPLLIGMLGAAWSPLISTQAGGAGASARTTVRGGIVIHWRIVEPPGPSGWSVVAATSSTVRAVETVWHVDAAHWRLTGRYVTPPKEAFLHRNGTVATPFSPFPGTVIRNGATDWHIDTARHRTERDAVRSDGMFLRNPVWNYWMLHLNLTGAPRSLRELITKLSSCQAVRREPDGDIAGRRVAVLRLGDNRCLWNSSASYPMTGSDMLGVDLQTLIPLRLDTYVPATHRLLFSRAATSIRYGVTLPPRLFTP